MRKTVLLLCALFTACAFIGCSSDDDDLSNSLDKSGVLTDGEPNEGVAIQPIDVSGTPIVEFFNAELPEIHDSYQDVRRTESFFIDPDLGCTIWNNIICVINSPQELANNYWGKKELPEIDFDKYTLIVGQLMMPFDGFYIGKKELVAVNDRVVFNMYARNDCEDDDILSLVVQPLYFWGLYPKLLQKDISLNLIKEYPHRTTQP